MLGWHSALWYHQVCMNQSHHWVVELTTGLLSPVYTSLSSSMNKSATKFSSHIIFIRRLIIAQFQEMLTALYNEAWTFYEEWWSDLLLCCCIFSILDYRLKTCIHELYQNRWQACKKGYFHFPYKQVRISLQSDHIYLKYGMFLFCIFLFFQSKSHNFLARSLLISLLFCRPD